MFDRKRGRPDRRTRCEEPHKNCGFQRCRRMRSSRGEYRWRARLGQGVSHNSRRCWKRPEGEPSRRGSPTMVWTATLCARLPPFSALRLVWARLGTERVRERTARARVFGGSQSRSCGHPLFDSHWAERYWVWASTHPTKWGLGGLVWDWVLVLNFKFLASKLIIC